MPISILMPALSPTMEKGKLAKWLLKEGDQVSAGDVLAEIETDKATMEIEAVEEGVLAKILVPDGTDDVPVNQAIAIILEEGEDVSALEGFDANSGELVAPPPTPPHEGEGSKDDASPSSPPVGEVSARSAALSANRGVSPKLERSHRLSRAVLPVKTTSTLRCLQVQALMAAS